ncbi:unnamed protein product [Zymoseptoria tritici ST99CH_1A5]|uniref:Uncharacterized protein n=2 Tax=Zymoseptoria tritici TaxID=1047171 RepID=A0A2H1G5J5_ZYMTR|nr:unnamed protein product [Zymoseptoria tritici ST99CH_1E4]SMY22720.1 unnamed protein product [Zymoseptoria tritici ST99CH_1A5]
MKLWAATTALLFSSSVAAAPPSDIAKRDIERRQQSATLQYWAGAVQFGQAITEVHGSFNVPRVSLPPNAERGKTYSGSAWVGIDDAQTCSEQILQAGIDWRINENGVQYYAWYQWWPARSGYWHVAIHPGDQIDIRVVAYSSTSGKVWWTNKSTGQSRSHSFQNEAPLCQGTAEWIVEDFILNGRVPMAAFTDVQFHGASYKHQGGRKDGLDGSTVVNMVQQEGVIVESQLTGPNSASCHYVGGQGGGQGQGV